MKKLASYLVLAFLFWTLPALAINMGQQLAPGKLKSGKTIRVKNKTDATTSPTRPATALLLGAGLIGLVAFSRNKTNK